MASSMKATSQLNIGTDADGADDKVGRQDSTVGEVTDTT
jgi:hypothetical protein